MSCCSPGEEARRSTSRDATPLGHVRLKGQCDCNDYTPAGRGAQHCSTPLVGFSRCIRRPTLRRTTSAHRRSVPRLRASIRRVAERSRPSRRSASQSRMRVTSQSRPFSRTSLASTIAASRHGAPRVSTACGPLRRAAARVYLRTARRVQPSATVLAFCADPLLDEGNNPRCQVCCRLGTCTSATAR